MKTDFKKFYSVIIAISFCITLFFSIFYIFTENIEILLFLLLSVFLSLILFSFNNIKYYVIHLFFYISIFIFLVSRPVIDYLKGEYFNTYQKDAYTFSFLIVIEVLFALFLGGVVSKITLKEKKLKTNVDKDYLKNIRIVSFFIYAITYPFYVLRLIERLIFKLNTDYYTYYATFKSKLPYFTYILSAFMIYAMCVYLASKPCKKNATLILVSNIFANSIYLMIGTRNPFILSLIFSFIYYFIRNQENMKKKWLGFKEKFLILISIPSLMVFMGFINYIRDKEKVKFDFFNLIIDFIYKQGTSFGVLARGYLYNSNIAVRDFVNFTFGPIIEYITKGNLGQLIFDTKPFVSNTNSIELAIKSNSYSHNLSYIVMKKNYLNGHGLGSSYIMENFTDYGYIGVFLFSFVLGFLFVRMLDVSYKNKILSFSCSLIILNNLFFMPRSSFSESFFSLITFQFWTIIIIIFFTSKLINKKNSYVLIERKI